MTSAMSASVSDIVIEEVAFTVRKMHEDGATPTQLLLFIGQQFGVPCADLEFQIMQIMRRAFGLTLKGATDAFLSPRMRYQYQYLHSDEEFDRMFGDAIEAARDRWPELARSASSKS